MKALIALTGLILSWSGLSDCQWQHSKTLGKIKNSKLMEISGLVDWNEKKRFFGVSDSGAKAQFFSFDYSAKHARKIELIGVKNKNFLDAESLSLRACPTSSRSCLYIADSGNNKLIKRRTRIYIIDLEQVEKGREKVHADVYDFNFSQGPQNIEAFDIDDQGHIFFITTGYRQKSKQKIPSKVFTYALKNLKKGKVHYPHQLGQIEPRDLWGQDKKPHESSITGMAISPSAQSFILLTYRGAIEFQYPPHVWLLKGPDNLLKRRSHLVRTLVIPRLFQQEALTYLTDDRHFVYTSERKKGKGESPLILMECRKK